MTTNPADQKYGPQTSAISTVIERAKRRTEDEGKALAAAWNETLGAEQEAARDTASWFVPWNSARYAALDSVRAAELNADRYIAFNAAWDAILALMARDKITPEQYALLVSPWERVMGPIKDVDEGPTFGKRRI